MKNLIFSLATFMYIFSSFSQDGEEEINFPTNWFFNSSKKKALEINYTLFNFHKSYNDFYAYRNAQALSFGVQDYNKFSKKLKSVRDDIFRFSFFLPESQPNGVENWERRGWQCSGTGGWDIFAWKIIDLTPNYGWAFGNRKFIISDSLNNEKVLKNPYFGLCLGLDLKFNVYIKNHGFSLGAYCNSTFDISGQSWKNKGEYAGLIPEKSKFHNLQIGLSLQYILKNMN